MIFNASSNKKLPAIRPFLNSIHFMGIYFHFVKNKLQEYNNFFWNNIIISLAIIISISYFSVLIGELYQTTASHAVIYTLDNDAGAAIRTLERTTLFNNNEFYPYGRTYYTVSRLLFEGMRFFSTDLDRYEFERLLHFSLLLTSFFSILILIWFFSSNISNKSSIKVLNFLLTTNILLSSKNWTMMIFKAHPDMLLCLSIGISSLSTLRYCESLRKKDLLIMSIYWGLSMAIKLSSSIFYIAVICTLLLTEGFHIKSMLKKLRTDIFKFIAISLFTYTIIGFPQHLNYLKTIEFINYYSALTEIANKNSIINHLSHIIKNGGIFFIGIMIIKIAFKTNSLVLGKKAFVLFSFYTFLSIILFLSKNYLVFNSYYTFPYIVLICLWIILVFDFFLKKIKYKKINIVWFLLLFFIACKEFNINSLKMFQTTRSLQVQCIPEIKKMRRKTAQIQKNEHNLLLATPYTPYDYKLPLIYRWTHTFSSLKNKNINYMILNKNFYSKYFKPSRLMRIQAKYLSQDLLRAKVFFTTFKEKQTGDIVKIKLQFWQKIDSSCNLEIWKKI